MVTELQTVVVISDKRLTITGNAFEINGTPKTGLTGQNFTYWIDKILFETTGTIDYVNHEFIEFDLGETLKIVNADLAEMLGLTYNTVYPASLFFAPRWGSSRLVLQNSANTTGTNSVMKSFDEVQMDISTDTTILRGFAPISNYEQDDDR